MSDRSEWVRLDPALADALRPTQRRRNRKIEHALHQEVAIRLAALKPHCVYIPIPNGIYLPARTEGEKALVRRLVSQMKASGQLSVGVADWLFLWDTGSGAIELKRPAARTLLEKIPKGRLSADQRTFRDWCASVGVPYRVADCWDDVLTALKEWKVI